MIERYVKVALYTIPVHKTILIKEFTYTNNTIKIYSYTNKHDTQKLKYEYDPIPNVSNRTYE